MKTIAIDIRPLLAGVGGVPEYTRHIITHIVKNHPEYSYVFFLNSYRILRNDSLPREKNITRIFFRRPSKALNASIAFLHRPNIDTLIQNRIKKRVDLFFAPNIDFFSFSGSTPVVLTVHDVTFNLYSDCFSLKQQIWHRMVRPRALMRSVARCIAVSEHTKRDMVQEFGIGADKICVVPLGIDPIFFQGEPLSRSRIRGLPEHYILALGARDMRKNASHIVYAYARARMQAPRMQKWKLVILGGARPLPAIAAAVEMCGVSNDVIFLDSVPARDRRALFAGARVFAYPSVYEGFGLPPIEAMACGVPVIGAAHSALSEISGDSAYCADPYHTTSLGNALIACTLDERVRLRLREKGRKCAQKFSWDASAKKTVALFRQLL